MAGKLGVVDDMVFISFVEKQSRERSFGVDWWTWSTWFVTESTAEYDLEPIVVETNHGFVRRDLTRWSATRGPEPAVCIRSWTAS
jgi:hypothetical protein